MIIFPTFQVGLLARKNLYSKMHQFCVVASSKMKEMKDLYSLSDVGQTYLKKVLEIEKCVEPFNRNSTAVKLVVNDH